MLQKAFWEVLTSWYVWDERAMDSRILVITSTLTDLGAVLSCRRLLFTELHSL